MPAVSLSFDVWQWHRGGAQRLLVLPSNRFQLVYNSGGF